MNIYTKNPGRGRRILRASRAVWQWYYLRGDLATAITSNNGDGILYTVTLTEADIKLLEEAKVRFLSNEKV